MIMKKIIKKPAIDYFEQMLKTGRPMIKKNSRKPNKQEIREQEVDDSLLEIYQDDQGKTIDVRRFAVRRRRWWVKLLLYLVYVLVVIAIGWLGYNYYTSYRAKTDLLVINVETDKNLSAGQEFAYIINYQNNGPVALDNLEIKINFPTSFVMQETDPAMTGQDAWEIGSLSAKSAGRLMIKGRLINKIGENNQIEITASFKPANLSSTFVINQDYNIILSDSNLAISLSVPDTMAIGRDNEAVIGYQAKTGNVLDNLYLSINNNNDDDWADIKLLADGQLINRLDDLTWLLPSPSDQLSNLKLIIKPKEETSGLKTLSLRLETKFGDNNYLIDSRDFDCRLINSRLNLLLKVNDSNADSGAFAGQVLNYQINYVNQGETTLKDVRLVVSLQGAWLDWSSLKDNKQGQVSGQTIIWSKKEMPELALLKPGAAGSIKFAIKLKDWENGDQADTGQISSYAYYQVGDEAIEQPKDDQKSNTIINQLNSDFKLIESVVYFNEDNMAVGLGPLPMIVGETTNLKTYWRLDNTRHDLRDVVIEVELPDYITWGGKDQASIGQINYDQISNRVSWQIDRLPVSSQAVAAEFNIAVTPRPEQANQIIILLPGSSAGAIDNVTQVRLESIGQAKTSRLIDDQIAQTDGLVK